MAVVLDPFTGQLIEVGGKSAMSIGGSVAGADPNAILITDAFSNLSDIQLDGDGKLLIGQLGGAPVAATLTQASASQVIITNGPGAITLGLPQDISSADTPEFASLKIGNNGNIDNPSDSGAFDTLNIGSTFADIINIGRVGATVNIYGTTFYQEVTNLEVSDKNITLNKNGSVTSGGLAGIEIEENSSITGYARVSSDRNSWELKAPNTDGIVTITPGSLGFTIDQGSHNPVTIHATANGLEIDSNQVLSIKIADTDNTGALSSDDWDTFNNKQDALTFGDISTTTVGVTIVNGTGSTVGPNVTINIATANTDDTGLLTSDDWDYFDAKVNRSGDVMTGNLDMETAGPGETLTLSTGGITSNVALSVQTTGTGVDGVLSFDAEKISASNNKIEDVADPVNPQDAMTLNYADNTYLPIDTFEDYGQVTKEPTGFVNRTDSAISFDDLTRTFSIQPTGLSYDFYIKGVKFTKTGVDSVSIPAPYTTGEYFIYFDAAGTLVITNTFNISIITDNAYVSIVYWNETAGSRVYFAEERHGLTMDGTTHSYLHTIFGARYLSGGALQGFSIDDSTNNPTNANSQFTADSGSIRDEDILITYPAQTQIPILYRIGTVWKKKAADAFPVIYTGSVGGDYAGTTLPYNKLTAGVWSLEPITDNKFVLIHIFATNDVDNPIIGIQGIAEYGDVSSARTAATDEITTLSGLPFTEFVALGSVVFETKTAYPNTTNAKVRSISVGVNYVDFRGTQPYAPQYGAASSHSILSNLSSDDHLQYFNEERGDLRYVKKAGDTMTGALEMSDNNITGLADPINPQDAVNKRWVEDRLNDISVTCYDISPHVGPNPPPLPHTVDDVVLSNGDRVLFAFDNNIYEVQGTSWVQDLSFIASEGDVVAIRKGTVFGLQFAKFNGSEFEINKTVRYFNEQDYLEQSSPITVSLPASSTDLNIFTIPLIGSENMIIEYSIIRDSNKITGTLHLSTNGSFVAISDSGAELGSVGVIFDAIIPTPGNISLICDVDSVGGGAILKYMVRRWSDGFTGPAGLPGYTAPGIVSSVGLSMPSEFTVSNSPVTSSGTLTVTKNDQVANTVYAGPVSGPDAQPTFRSLVSDDLPQIPVTKLDNGTNASSSTYWRGDGTWATVISGSNKASFYDLVVGNTAQVTAGTADYDSLQDAIDALPTGGTILVLSTYQTVEPINIDKDNICIYGQGNRTEINGPITLDTNIGHCVINSVRINNSITLSATNNYNYITNFWAANAATVTDNGTDNYILGILE